MQRAESGDPWLWALVLFAVGNLANAVWMLFAPGGWYAGLDAGSANSDASVNEYGFFGDTTARGSDTTTGWRLRGGYQFGRFFALEVAYVDFGEVDYHFDPDDCPFGAPGPCPFDVRSSSSGFVGTVRGILPIGDHWFMDAGLGYGKMRVDANEIGGGAWVCQRQQDARRRGSPAHASAAFKLWLPWRLDWRLARSTASAAPDTAWRLRRRVPGARPGSRLHRSSCSPPR